MKKIIYILNIILILASCTTSTGPDRNAIKLTINDLKSTPGYEWYDIEYNKFQPNPGYIQQINSAYKNTIFFLYVNPSCACTGTYNLFPSIMKCLISAGIPESNIKIYSMLDIGYTHEMMNKFAINSLPSCFNERTSSNYYSIIDSMNMYLALNSSDSANIIERTVLKSIK